MRVKPLAFWRNERIIYNLDRNHQRPEIKEIIYADSPVQTKRKGGRRTKTTRNSTTSRKKRVISDSEDESMDKHGDKENNNNSSKEQEEKIEMEGIVEAEVFNYPDTETKHKRIISWAPSHIQFRDVKNASYTLATLYDGDSGFTAGGIIEITIDGEKPMKPSKQNHYIFYVISGNVEVNVSDRIFKLGKGGSFEVPRGNFYSIKNLASNQSRLFFVQSTDTLTNQELDEDDK